MKGAVRSADWRTTIGGQRAVFRAKGKAIYRQPSEAVVGKKYVGSLAQGRETGTQRITRGVSELLSEYQATLVDC